MAINKISLFDSDSLKNFHKRIFFSILVFIFFFTSVFYRITEISISSYFDDKLNIISKENLIRGNIYDRNGTLLSTSIETYSLGAKPFELKNKKKLSKQLSLITLLDEKKIFKLLNQEKSYVPIKRNISPRERQKIINLGEIGLTTKKSTKRIYPYQNIASHALGYVDTESIGLSGIERGMNEELSNGEDVYLSLDINLQAAIGEELRKSINKFSAKSGAVLVMKISNGEIISMNSFPDFDPNNNKTFKKYRITDLSVKKENTLTKFIYRENDMILTDKVGYPQFYTQLLFEIDNQNIMIKTVINNEEAISLMSICKKIERFERES